MDTDRTAFDHALLAILDDLRAYAMSRCRTTRDDAEELLSRSLVRILSKWHQFEPGTNLKAWCFTLMRHAQMDDFRRIRRERINELSGPAWERLVDPKARDPETQVFVSEIVAETRKQKAEWQDLILAQTMACQADVAADMGISVNTLKSRSWRARDDLRHRLGLLDAVL